MSLQTVPVPTPVIVEVPRPADNRRWLIAAVVLSGLSFAASVAMLIMQS